MRHRLDDLLDIPRLKSGLDSLYLSSKIPSAIIDNEGNVHTGSGWQDVCTKFHRVHPEGRKRCIESDLYISRHIHEANPSITYNCPHGLVDSATPIIIEGEHLGNVFTGQLFFEEPDLDSFRAQARVYGFDEEKYIAAVRKVPIISEQAMRENLAFISDFTGMLAEMGLKHKREKEVERRLRESEGRYRSLFCRASDGIFIMSTDGKLIEVNESFARMHGYATAELLQMTIDNLDTPETLEMAPERVRRLLAGENLIFEVEHYHKDGHVFPLEVSASLISSGGESYIQSFHRDITERTSVKEQNLRSREELRMLTCHLQESIEEERRRIAREIHDELGQQLTALKNDLAWTESHLRESSPHLAGKVHSMTLLAEGTTRSVHSIIHELRPPLLDDLGLPEAIDWQVSEFRRRTGIACELDAVLDDFDLEPEAVTGVFRLLQEMLTNVARHSGAKRCQVRIRRRRNGVFLSVYDDGTGIPAARIVDPGSFGLLGMRERVLGLGGRFRIRGAPGKGTIVAVTIPVRPGKSSPESDGGAQDAG